MASCGGLAAVSLLNPSLKSSLALQLMLLNMFRITPTNLKMVQIVNYLAIENLPMLHFAFDLHLNFGNLISALTDSFTGLIAFPILLGCTRAVYQGLDGLVITGRTMDWLNDMQSNLWAFPRGIERDGAAGTNSIRWVSQYGSVGVSGWDIGIADGMNEAGLFANLLYLVETQYPIPAPSDLRQPLSLSLWAQYFLDNFATVSEAIAAMDLEPFYVVPAISPDGKPGTIHLSLSDATGDSAACAERILANDRGDDHASGYKSCR